MRKGLYVRSFLRSLLLSAPLGATLLAGAPVGANATGLEIDVAGEAEGTIIIDLFEDVAPLHVERIVTLVEEGAYDDVVFHRVIDGFMAQTGDVEFGNMGQDMRYAGRGGSTYDDLPAEFSDLDFGRGTLGMARSQRPDFGQQPVLHRVRACAASERPVHGDWSGGRGHGRGRHDPPGQWPKWRCHRRAGSNGSTAGAGLRPGGACA